MCLGVSKPILGSAANLCCDPSQITSPHYDFLLSILPIKDHKFLSGRTVFIFLLIYHLSQVGSLNTIILVPLFTTGIESEPNNF